MYRAYFSAVTEVSVSIVGADTQVGRVFDGEVTYLEFEIPAP